MKVINVSEFRTKLREYLEACEKEPLIVTSSKGKAFVLQPLDKAGLDLNQTDSKDSNIKRK